MVIETQRLLIRDLNSDDEIAFVEMASDGSLNDVGFNLSCSSWMGKWIVEARELAKKDIPDLEYLAYTITLKDENVAVGSVGCSYYKDLREIGITYFIGAKYRNNGYAVEAVKAYMEYFFEHYDVSRMIATVREANIQSCKVVEKAGFQLTEKKMYRDINDKKAEMYHFYEFCRKKEGNEHEYSNRHQ